MQCTLTDLLSLTLPAIFRFLPAWSVRASSLLLRSGNCELKGCGTRVEYLSATVFWSPSGMVKTRWRNSSMWPVGRLSHNVGLKLTGCKQNKPIMLYHWCSSKSQSRKYEMFFLFFFFFLPKGIVLQLSKIRQHFLYYGFIVGFWKLRHFVVIFLPLHFYFYFITY